MNRAQNFIENLLLKDRRWGLIRFGFVVLSLLFFSYLGYFAFHRVTVTEIVQDWIERSKILEMIPGFILSFFAFIKENYRFLWLNLGGLLVALFIGAAYLRNFFHDQSFKQSLSYLVRSLFAFNYPSITVKDGNLTISEDESNLLHDFGGPGSIVVQPGNVVVLEHLVRPSKVLAEGIHSLSRFERIKELKSDYVADGKAFPTLDERHGFVERISATTKDGIEVIITDINYRYRLRMAPGFGDHVQRDPNNPYPISIKAVMAMNYNRSVRLNADTLEPELTPWHDLVDAAVQNAIVEYVQEHQFDDLMKPSFVKMDADTETSQKDLHTQSEHDQGMVVLVEFPRDVISRQILSKDFRSRVRQLGADLLWWDIGHISIRNPVIIQQMIDKWGAYWDGRATMVRARGEAERVQLRELAKAETQAELLIGMLNSFETVLSSVDKEGKTPDEIKMLQREKLRNIILAKTTKLLDGRTTS